MIGLLLLILQWTNPACAQGFMLRPDSPAIDAGVIIPGFHCPIAGPGDGTCIPWYGKAPDIGACEFIPIQGPAAPTGLVVQ